MNPFLQFVAKGTRARVSDSFLLLVNLLSSFSSSYGKMSHVALRFRTILNLKSADTQSKISAGSGRSESTVVRSVCSTTKMVKYAGKRQIFRFRGNLSNRAAHHGLLLLHHKILDFLRKINCFRCS